MMPDVDSQWLYSLPEIYCKVCKAVTVHVDGGKTCINRAYARISHERQDMVDAGWQWSHLSNTWRRGTEIRRAPR